MVQLHIPGESARAQTRARLHTHLCLTQGFARFRNIALLRVCFKSLAPQQATGVSMRVLPSNATPTHNTDIPQDASLASPC